MINKIMTADEAVAGVKDGMTIMVGGFLATGSPEVLMDALVRKGVKHLTVIANDGGLDVGQPAGEFAGKTSRGVGKLLDNHMVDHIIASHIGVNPKINEQIAEGTLRYTLVPQGTLAEKIRAAAYGLGGVLTPTGVGTPMETEVDELGRTKKVVEIEGKKYLFELPLHADYAFIRPSLADKFGNYMCAKATKNFNYVMAGAAKHTIIAPEKRCAKEFQDGDFVNLGIGLPTQVADYIPDDIMVTFHSENGFAGIDAVATENPDVDIINSGGTYVTVVPRVKYFDTAESFGLVRGGHVKATVLGAMEVAENGDLANWIVPGKKVAGMGGAMDLCAGCPEVIIVMLHTQKGTPKIKKRCSLPLTAEKCVSKIITEMGVMEVREDGIWVTELHPDYTKEDIQAATECELHFDPNMKAMEEE